MFRKPKARNIRQRSRIDENGDENEIEDENAGNVSSKRPPVQSFWTNDGEANDFDEESTSLKSKARSILSFNEEEGEDIDFKMKRSSGSHYIKSAKKKTKKVEIVETQTKSKIKAELEEKEVIVVKELNSDKCHPTDVGKWDRSTSLSQKPKFKIPEKMDDDEKDEDRRVLMDKSDVTERFSTSLVNIPDARAVYEARKKREQMRLGGGNGFIPLDDTIRLRDPNSKRSGERSRLVREDDDNDMSDEEETGKFYSSKSLLITEEEQRRDQQTQFLRIEQGVSDSEEEADAQADSDEDELVRWEREQINKGVSRQRVNQLQNELNAASLYYRGRSYAVPVEEGDADMEVEVLDTTTSKPNFSLPNGSLPGSSSVVNVEDVLAKIQLQITNRQEHYNTAELELTRTEENLSENQIMIGKLAAHNPNLQQRFRMFQEIRQFVRDLLECLNEKIEDITNVENQIFNMWKKRRERLTRRTRQDVQDQYERCAALSAGRPWTAPNPDYAVRESEREARRSRRRREREKCGISNHNDGLSSDDEETTSQSIVYTDTLASVTEQASNVFIDTADEFCSVKAIINRFVDWLVVDADSYEQAYVSLCLPKLISPFIRLELIDWNVLQDSSRPLHTHDWYKELLSVGLENFGVDAENLELVNIIPSVVEKVILPKISRVVEEQWNPLSLSESRNLAATLNAIIDDYPTITARSKRTNELLSAIYKRAKEAVDDIFVPLYSQDAIMSVETGCCAFLDRQFWRSIKLIRVLSCFRNILSEFTLEELIIEGAMNRGAIVALQFSILTDPASIAKCRALIEAIPTSWLSSSAHPQSYGPLANVLSMVINNFRHKDREFCKQAQKFVDAATRNMQ